MRIKQEIIINDEPWIAEATGKRTATLTYNGPRYVYLEYDTERDEVMALAHISESTPDMEGALEKLTPLDTRIMLEIDAEERLIIAAHFWDIYTLEVEKYVEELADGSTYTYEYNETPKLGEIFSFHNIVWDAEKNDFETYPFVVSATTDKDMEESVNVITEKIKNALVENTALTDEEKSGLNDYLKKLAKFKKNLSSGIEHWKMEFPICNIPY